MKAINLFAGTGTLTRAFQSQGVEVIWAQSESKDEAQIYRYNFPEIPFYLGKLSDIADTIPDHDLLLASLSDWSYSVVSGKRASAHDDNSRNQLKLIDKLLSKHQPQAVCIMLPAYQLQTKHEEILELLRQEKYEYSYQILEREKDGGVPVRGRKGYLIGIRKDRNRSEFLFPAPCEHVKAIEELWKAEEQKDIYYKIPLRYEELLAKQELKHGKLYHIISRRKGTERQFELRECTACPILTALSYKDVFVKDSQGIRNLTAKEYLQLSGDTETMLPISILQYRIWRVLDRSGVYAIEKRLASQLLKALQEKPKEILVTSLQRELAEHLLQTFERFPLQKKAGLLCIPPGLGRTAVLSYLVQKMTEKTNGKLKIIILSAYSQVSHQISKSLMTAEIQAQLAVSQKEVYDFLLNGEQVLITSYMKWSDCIKDFQLKDYHHNLILIGMEPEIGWRQLTETRKYLPQIIYAGITSAENSGAEKIFGPVRYTYSLAQAIREQYLVPVSIEGEEWEAEEGVDGKAVASVIKDDTMLDWIWKDLSLHQEKTMLIAESVKQAEALNQEFDRRCMEQGEECHTYLCHSLQNPRERGEQLNQFRTSAVGNLITVNMWRMLLEPKIGQIYILGKTAEESLPFIISLVARKFSGKNSGRLVILDPDLRGEARILLEQEENFKELQSFCSFLLEEQYEKAAKSFQELSRQTNHLSEQLKKELEVLENVRDPGTALTGKIMVRLWLLLSRVAMPWEGLKKCAPAEEAEKELSKEVNEERLPEDEHSISRGKKENPYKTSVEKGRTLEQALFSLLSHLFTWEPANVQQEASTELDYIQKKPSGTQNGRDLDLIYLDETGQKRRCYFECKYIDSKFIKEGTIQTKIHQARRAAKEDIEHWILVAPNCRLDSYSVELFEEEERQHRFYPPIKNIQVWNAENKIEELMGLEPELYERFFGKPTTPEEDPVNWSEDKKQRIIQKWKRKLMPVLMLPMGLIRYPFEPERLMFDLQNDLAVRKQYEDLYLRRTKLKFYEENGTLSQEYLEENMLHWLNAEGEWVRVALGDFGDGKTFFLYCLCRRLLEEFVKNPDKNYLPICISLKNLERTKDPKAFIEQRMKELSCDYADFLKLKEKFHVLICLDGFDEISSVIDGKTVSKNIRLLKDCIELMTRAKILITSRTQCFVQNNVREWLSESVGGLKLLRLAPVEAEDRKEFLLSSASEEKRIEWQEQIFADKKLFALMGKPFFLDMMGQLLVSGEQVFGSSVSIYEHYIRECLKRKFDRSFMYKEDMLLNKKETVDRIYEALSGMAYSLWLNRQEILSVEEFETYLGKPTAEVLWKEKNPDENEREDADHRFSMRTLFQYTGASRVKFSHRSIQEYFVAVYLQHVLQENFQEFGTLLRDNYFNDEILRFLSELITEDKPSWEVLRQKLIQMVEDVKDEKSQIIKGKSLSGKIMQLFYFADKRIPKADWHEKNLSNVDIPGADLSGQNLSGSLFVNANLNNVCFNDCDCSYCDMTDARLEETCSICAMQYQRSELKCLYRDGSLRKWEVRQLKEISHMFPVPLLGDTYMGEHGEIFTQSKDKIRVIETQNGEAFVRQEYKKHRERSLICAQGQKALIKEWNKGRARILLVDIQDYRIVKGWGIEEDGSGNLIGGKFVVVYEGKGKIELFSVEKQENVGAFVLELPGTLITFDAAIQEDGVEFAVGCNSGDIFVYRYRQGTLHLMAQGRQQGLKYVALCENQSLAAADGEGTVHMMHWEDGKRQLYQNPADTMKLGIYCRNIKTEGLIPETVRKRLREHSLYTKKWSIRDSNP